MRDFIFPYFLFKFQEIFALWGPLIGQFWQMLFYCITKHNTQRTFVSLPRSLNKIAELNSINKQSFSPYLLSVQHCSLFRDYSEQTNGARAKFLFPDSGYIVVYLTITESMMKSWKQVVQYTNMSTKDKHLLLSVWGVYRLSP